VPDCASRPSHDRRRRRSHRCWSRRELSGYAYLESTRPQTLSCALTDSPVGQLAWIVQKFKDWTDPAPELPEEAVDRDRLLTNVTLYWLTATAGSSANLYYEGARAWGAAQEPSPVATGVAVFPGDLAARCAAERANNIVHWSEFDRGSHFAAMEAPDLLIADVGEFFRRLRCRRTAVPPTRSVPRVSWPPFRSCHASLVTPQAS
jgi:epoxide hydrolase